MAKRCDNYLITITSLVFVILCLSACTQNKNYEYSTAKYNNTFSTLGDVICWITSNHLTTNTHLYLSKDNNIKNASELNLTEDHYYDNPLLVGEYLYYVGGVKSNHQQELYIARINYIDEDSNLEKLTDTYPEILSYTACDNVLYYIATNDEGSKLYKKNLSNKKEEILIDDAFGPFCTNGKNLIIGNVLFDVKSKESRIIIDNESVMSLGVIDNYYYCFNFTDAGHDLIRIDLVDNSIKTLCQIPSGWDLPKMSGDKILFTTGSNKNSKVGYCYYDISKDIIVIVIDADDAQDRYIYVPIDMAHYDYTLYDNMYYLHYPDRVTRMNIETKKEELFCLVFTKVENGYSYKGRWLTYDEYLQELNNDLL